MQTQLYQLIDTSTATETINYQVMQLCQIIHFAEIFSKEYRVEGST